MELLEIIILGIVQGITEFLPVSSSGHLVVAAAIFEACGANPPHELIEVNIVLHLGTLLSVLAVYWRRVVRLMGVDRRVIPLLIVGTVPAVLVGLPLKKLAPQLLESALLAGLMFPITATMLILASRRAPGDQDYPAIGFGQALLIGVFQAVAILPGISRSGATIVAGLLVGMRRDSSAAFAFLLAIPAIAGAGVLESLDLLRGASTSTPPGLLAVGALVSFVVGYGALSWLIRLVERGRLIHFAWWLIPFGLVVTVWQIAALLRSAA